MHFAQRLFSNRDYVFQRRWIVNKEEGLIIIVSKVTEHPNVPVIRRTHRYIKTISYISV